jgi:hypothetical protein
VLPHRERERNVNKTRTNLCYILNLVLCLLNTSNCYAVAKDYAIISLYGIKPRNYIFIDEFIIFLMRNILNRKNCFIRSLGWDFTAYYGDGFEVFTAVTMKNVVFWDIKSQFVRHRKQYFSATESSQLMLCKI